MTDELYLTGVVIANGVPDVDEDVLTAKDIKIIFAKYTNRLTDINHNDISYYGIEVLANWISETDTTIAGRPVPAKSWLATVKVMNPDIVDLVNKGELRGFSLSSTYVGEVDKKNDERVSYSDLRSSEEIIPIRISLVKKPANGFAFEEADYETFINKMEADKLSDENKFSLSDLKNIFKFKTDLEDNLIEKSAPEDDGNTGDRSIEALFEKVDNIEEKVSSIAESLKGEEPEPKEDIEKDDGDSEGSDDSEEEVEDEPKEETKKKIEKEADDESEKKITKSAEETDTKKINKSGVTSKAHDVPDVPAEKPSTFYGRTKRDHLGRKIRK